MAKVLLLDDNDDLLQAIEVLLLTEFDIDIVAVSTVKEALEKLDRFHFDLIICDYLLPDGKGDQVFEAAQKNRQGAFLLFTGMAKEDCPEIEKILAADDLNAFIPKPFEEDYFFNCVRKALEKSLSEKKLLRKEDYRPVDYSILKRYPGYLVDLYIKLGEDHFVKIIDAGEATNGGIEHYLQKGIKIFYIHKLQLQDFFAHIRARLFDDLNTSALDNQSLVKVAGLTLDFSHQLLINLGLRRYDIEMSLKVVESTVQRIKKEAQLSEFLKLLDKNAGHFKNHALMSLFLGTALLTKMDWASPQIFEKFSYACFFHDFAIPDQDLSEWENEDISGLENAQQVAILEHPTKASKELAKYEFIPADTLTIIQEHHERPDGTGYPHKYDANRISPLSCVFIIVHDLANFIIKNDYQTSGAIDFMLAKENQYNRGNFKKIYKSMNLMLA